MITDKTLAKLQINAVDEVIFEELRGYGPRPASDLQQVVQERCSPRDLSDSLTYTSATTSALNRLARLGLIELCDLDSWTVA
jgi:chromosome condensin MukBEF MukE localization factor